MRRFAVLVAAVGALAVAGAAQAGLVQRLTYAKAVAYWKAEAKAHGMPIRCNPFDPNFTTADYGCTFGTVNRTRIMYGGKCEIVVVLYEKSHSVRGGNELNGGVGSARIPICRTGWQRQLPSPWNVPPH